MHITSPDISVKPTWDLNYMSQHLDMELMARSIQFVEKIVGTEPFSSKVLKSGRSRLPGIVADDLEKVKDINRQHQLSMWLDIVRCCLKTEAGL
jgi:hypothetical protein